MVMEEPPVKKQRAESIRLWVNTVAVVVSALAPIAFELMQAAGN
jgi:hypothetical protein